MLKSLSGANALLTGGSQGIGPYIARRLAQAGVNQVLTARSVDKLDAVAREVAALSPSVRVVPIAADITQADDRARLIQQAEMTLGPIDILINNAGIMLNGAFMRKTPDEIECMITTNLNAPMLLTHALLPGMLYRRRGHIVNMASIAGKGGVAYSGVYGATKAAVLAWNMALRIELEGTGVSVSAITPGYVSEVGVFARLKTRPHPIFGQVKPDAVARAVLHALRKNSFDIVVNSTPFIQPLQIMFAAAPGLTVWFGKQLGIIRSWKRLYDHPE